MRFSSLHVVALCLFVACPVLADPVDTIGVSWSGRGTAGACTAGGDGPAAAAYNPSLSGSAGPSFFVGYLLLHNSLEPELAGSEVNQHFVEAGLALPIADFGDGGDLWVSLTAISPTESLYDIDLFDDEDISYLLFGSRERRMSLSAAMAWNLWGILGVGAGFEMLPTVTGSVQADLTDAAGHNEFHVDVGYRLSPTAGLFFHVHPDIRIGVSYRAENRTNIELPVEVEADGLEMSAAITAQTYYVPHRLNVGIEASMPFGLATELDIGWYHYSGFPLPSPAVALYDLTGLDTLTAATARLSLHDVVSPAVAVKYAGPFAAALGYRFVPAATDEQVGPYNVLDNSRHQVSAGGRVPIPGVSYIGISALYITADITAAWLMERRDYKESLLFDNPGYPVIRYGGFRLSGGLGIEVAY